MALLFRVEPIAERGVFSISEVGVRGEERLTFADLELMSPFHDPRWSYSYRPPSHGLSLPYRPSRAKYRE
jgi:hypothetical protein